MTWKMKQIYDMWIFFLQKMVFFRNQFKRSVSPAKGIEMQSLQSIKSWLLQLWDERSFAFL